MAKYANQALWKYKTTSQKLLRAICVNEQIGEDAQQVQEKSA